MKRLLAFACGVVCCAVPFSILIYANNLSSLHPMTTTRQIIRTPDAPRSPLYSQAVKVGSTIYVTGIIGVDPATNQVPGPTIQEQTRQSLINCTNVLRAAGATLENVVEVQVLLARPTDFDGMNEEYAKFFPTDPPIRSTTRLGLEHPKILVSIKMTAILLN
jgi:reactive intermediate/imine deaminase